MENKIIEEKDLIVDFGHKIGGARKDDCKITRDEYEFLSEKAQREACTKQNIWKVSYKKMLKDTSPIKVGWTKLIYEAIPKPDVWFKDERDEYFSFVLALKELVYKYLALPMAQFEAKIYCFGYEYNDFYREVQEIQSKFVRNQRFKNACLTTKNDIVHYLLKKDLYFTPYERAKLTTAVCHLDGENNKLETNGDDFYLVVKRGRSATFRHSDLYKSLQVGDWFLVNSWFETMYKIIEDEDQKNLMKEAITAKSIEEANEKLEHLCQVYAKTFEAAEKKKASMTTKSGKKRKVAWKPNITIDYANRRDCEVSYKKDFTGDDYLETFGFYGGEFGNWLDQDERQITLNCGYDSFMDLAYCLGVTPKTISLGGKLSIAFGARGKGGKGAFAAHYEPLYNVINLTKMRGAGCLAHEWGHALDYYLSDNGMANEVRAVKKTLVQKSITVHVKPYTPEEMLEKRRELCRSLVDRRFEVYDKPNATLYVGGKEYVALSDEQKESLKQAYVDAFTLDRTETSKRDCSDRIKKLKETVIELTGTVNLWSNNLVYMYNSWEQIVSPTEEKDVQKMVDTDYLKESRAFGEQYTAQGLGYWQDEVEMFARAFDQYVCENLGFKNLFLTSKDLIEAQPHPKGEEKQAIQEAIKKLIETACEKGLLEKFNYSSEDHLREFYAK